MDGLSEDRVRGLLAAFLGEVEQMPPMHSALKHRGRPLYAYAREGTEIERLARKVIVHELELVAWRAAGPGPSARALLEGHLRARAGRGSWTRGRYWGASRRRCVALRPGRFASTRPSRFRSWKSVSIGASHYR